MAGKAEKKNNSLDSVICSVNSCYYNHDGDKCMASHIHIEPPDARDSEQTDCATFMPRNS